MPTRTSTPSDWLSTTDAARLLGLSADRVRQLARGGHLPYADTPYGRLFNADAVRAAHDQYQSDRRLTARPGTQEAS